MSFDDTVPALEAAAIEQRAAAKGFLLNILDLATQEASVLIPLVVADIVKVAREHIPAAETSALAVFDSIVAGNQVSVENALTVEVQKVFSLAATSLDKVIPGTVVKTTQVITASSTTVEATTATETTPPEIAS